LKKGSSLRGNLFASVVIFFLYSAVYNQSAESLSEKMKISNIYPLIYVDDKLKIKKMEGFLSDTK
jgi:hypothetical protein